MLLIVLATDVPSYTLCFLTVAVIIVSTCSLYVTKFDAPISKIFTDAARSATKAVGGNIHYNFVNEHGIVRL